MSDRQLVLDDFADKVGQVFTIGFSDAPAVALTLVEAEPLNTNYVSPSGRQSFSLIFVSGGELILPQRLYWMEHDVLGQMELFLVPVGKKPEGIEYQALFN